MTFLLTLLPALLFPCAVASLRTVPIPFTQFFLSKLIDISEIQMWQLFLGGCSF